VNMTIRPLTPTERDFTYSQQQEIMERAGCIGYLRADMGSSGKGFFSVWNDYRKDLKTQAFKDEFDSVINGLRFNAAYGGILKDRCALSRYCYPARCLIFPQKSSHSGSSRSAASSFSVHRNTLTPRSRSP